LQEVLVSCDEMKRRLGRNPEKARRDSVQYNWNLMNVLEFGNIPVDRESKKQKKV
jgi:hypothetical protein